MVRCPEVKLQNMRNAGNRETHDSTSAEPQGIIIDHTNKYTVVENWLFERGDLGACDKLLYIVLKSWANCERIWPSHKTLAKKASVSLATVKRSLRCLMGKKLLVVESGKMNGGCNVYHLCGPGGQKGISRGVAHRELPPLAHHELPGSSHRATTNTSVQIQDTTTTVVVVEDFKKLAKGTPFEMVGEQSLREFSKKYGLKRVFDTLDMLIATYRQSGKQVNNPVAILASGLLKGVTPPFDYVPYYERIENERKTQETAKGRRMADENKRAKEEEVYCERVTQFDVLPQEEREKWFKRARLLLPPPLRTSQNALKCKAFELWNKDLQERKGTPDATERA